jgi:hypothetical protein
MYLLAPAEETCKNREQNILHDPIITYSGFSNLTVGFKSIHFFVRLKCSDTIQ